MKHGQSYAALWEGSSICVTLRKAVIIALWVRLPAGIYKFRIGEPMQTQATPLPLQHPTKASGKAANESVNTCHQCGWVGGISGSWLQSGAASAALGIWEVKSLCHSIF